MKQHQKVLLGFVLGILFGLISYYTLPVKIYPFMKPLTETFTLIGGIFLRLIFMVVVPLLVSALILGVFELGKGRGLGKVASRSIMFTLVLSSIAVLLAISLTNIIEPGAGVVFDKASITSNASVLKIQDNAKVAQSKPWFQYILEQLTQNPIDSAARAFSGEIIALMIFSLIFGYALSLVVKEDDNPFIKVLDTIFNASLKVIDMAMKLAPYAVFGLIFNTTYALGAGFLKNVGMFAAIVVGSILIQQFIVYAFFLKAFAKVNPWSYFKACKDVYLYAFTTASSNATLPIALETAERVLHLPSKISRFVLTIGASANQNGSALFEGVTVLFLAQVFGVNLSIESQIFVVLMSILAGIGTAGVPGGTLPIIVVLLASVGVPAEGIGLILGVDRFLDMCRTTLNVSGDLVIAKLVSANVSESELHNTDLPM